MEESESSHDFVIQLDEFIFRKRINIDFLHTPSWIAFPTGARSSKRSVISERLLLDRLERPSVFLRHLPLGTSTFS